MTSSSFVARLAGLATVALMATTPLLAGEVKVGSLIIEQPWIRATPAGAKVAGGFASIVNTGSESDRLVGGSAPFSERVELHEMSVTDGVMKMRPLAEGLEIPAGGSVTLKPGSYHVMFMGLAEPMKEGERRSAMLVLEKAGPVEVVFTVEGIAAKGPSAGGEGHGSHGGAMDHGHGMDHGAKPD